jgi:hypothetical protein
MNGQALATITHYHYCRTCTERKPCPLKGCENTVPIDTCTACQDKLVEQGMDAIGGSR